MIELWDGPWEFSQEHSWWRMYDGAWWFEDNTTKFALGQIAVL